MRRLTSILALSGFLVKCTGCAVETRLGDWLGEFGCHAAHLAVRFYNWPPLEESFLVALGGRLGPRWRVIYGRV